MMRCLSSAVFVAIAWLEFLPRTDGFFSCSHLRSPLFQHGNSKCLSISSALRVRREISGEESIQEEVMILRGSEIKKILKTLNAEIKGLFEKEELAKVLVKYEVNSRGTSNIEVGTVTLYDQTDFISDANYVGIDVEIKSKKTRFMIDTGATINLITKNAFNTLGLDGVAEDVATIGVGGVGKIANRKTRIDKAIVGNSVVAINAAVLEDVGVLPDKTAGLLGLAFLESLGDVVEFDFSSNTLRFGPRGKMLSPLKKYKFHEINTRRITTGLVVADVFVNGGSQAYTAMIDLGFTSTMANPPAAQAITGAPLEKLPMTSRMYKGPKGEPMTMRSLVLSEFRIGNDAVTVGPISAYSADIPGFAPIGLSSQPAFLLGMDILRRNTLMLDLEKNKMYIMK